MQRENKKMAIARTSFQGFPDFTVKLIPARANFDTFFKIHYFRWFFRRVQSIYINGFLYFPPHIVGIPVNKNRLLPGNLMFFVFLQVAVNSIVCVLVFNIFFVLVLSVLKLLTCFSKIFHLTRLAADDVVHVFLCSFSTFGFILQSFVFKVSPFFITKPSSNFLKSFWSFSEKP